MEDPKQLIAQECQQVQEQLLKLISERSNLHREFEKLTRSSHTLLQQIQEDTSYASERKLNNYEAEKRRIEEKLEALEIDIEEKDKRIALLDAKAGDYLLQGDRIQVITASMEQSISESAASGPCAGPGPGPGKAEIPGVEERLRAAHATCQALTAKVDKLTRLNQQLNQCLEDKEQEKEGTAKTIAMLEFNNEHSKNKVHNMELSLQDLRKQIEILTKEKDRLVHHLREGSSSGLYDELTREKEELGERLTSERDELQRCLTREKVELQERLTQEKEELEELHHTQSKKLQEQLDGLLEIRQGYEKQIGQIETNNAEMHIKIGAVQLERDAARSEVKELAALKLELEGKMGDLSQHKERLEEEIGAHKATIGDLEDKVESAEGRIQAMTEAANTLQNNILNLQKQVEGLNQTCGKLARDLEAESKLRLDTQAQLAEVQKAKRQVEEKLSADQVDRQQRDKRKNADQLTKHQVEERLSADQVTKDWVGGQMEDVAVSTTALLEAKQKCVELQVNVTQLEADNRILKERLRQQSYSPYDTSEVDVGSEQLTEKMITNTKQRNSDDEEMTRLRAVVKEKDEELTQIRQSLKDLQERLSLAEVVSGEVEEQRSKAAEAEARLAAAERQHQARIMAIEADAERRVAETQQLCHQTISSAFDQQDSETSILVQQQQEVLKEAQARAREKAAQLESVIQDYEAKLKDKDEELCQFVQQYEDQLVALRRQHEAQVKEVEAAWQARAEKMAKQREAHKQREMDDLTNEWNKERRELERLTQVAAAAFRSGTESVELLKKQVAAQRRELEDVRLSHAKEVGELKALLELKRRTRSGGSGGSGGGGGAAAGGVRLGVALEEAAEFEYLKNILYQYMLGKETQTLSKVLCAVVKFDSQQQQEIQDHEEQRQNLIQSWTHGLGLY